MSSFPWTHLELEAFASPEEPLVYTVPGDTPGQRVDLASLHELFHAQTKYHRATASGQIRTIQAHLKDPALIARCVNGRHRRPVRGISLPEPAALSTGLGEALAGRKSAKRDMLCVDESAIREEKGSALTLENLSTLLHHSARSQRSAAPSAAPDLTQHFRPYPSAGALYPCEIYLAVANVEGLAAGIYRYDSLHHDLLLCPKRAGAKKGADTFNNVEMGVWDTPPACALIVTSVFERSVRKYGERGYRLALIEAGHILQNMSLVAGALALNSLVSASVYEAELEALLGIDGVSEAVLATFLVGPRQ